jgi:hypothetical protein
MHDPTKCRERQILPYSLAAITHPCVARIDYDYGYSVSLPRNGYLRTQWQYRGGAALLPNRFCCKLADALILSLFALVIYLPRLYLQVGKLPLGVVNDCFSGLFTLGV